jgi:hypothetical protein
VKQCAFAQYRCGRASARRSESKSTSYPSIRKQFALQQRLAALKKTGGVSVAEDTSSELDAAR